MKILQLNLIAFGPFTNEILDLSRGQEGLHIIYGLNEAGKSSALRAFRQLLYGIPERSSDDFRHPYGKMRIAGVLQGNDGSRLELVRRKGRVNTLRTGDDREPLDEAVLADLLGHVDGDVFATMFGINHSDLIRGGEALMQGGGELGQALFSAGAGIADLQKIREALNSEAEALFTPAASKKPINETLKAIQTLQKQVRDIQLPGREWERRCEALQQAARHRDEIVRTLEKKASERHRLGRIREALPLASRRAAFMKECESYTDAVILPDDFGERRRELIADLRIAETARDRSARTLEAINRSMQGLTVSHRILEAADRIEQAHRELGSFQKAQSDRIQLETRRQVLHEEAMEILSGLGKDLTLDEVERLRLKKSEIIRIQRLGAQYERLTTRRQTGREDLEKLTRQIDLLTSKLEAMPEARAMDDIKSMLARAVKYEALEEQYTMEEADIQRSLAGLEASLNKQTLWSGTLEAQADLPLPAMETIDRMEADLQFAENRAARLRADLEASDALAVDIEGQIRELEVEREVPTEERLLAARNHRDTGWGLIRNLLETGKRPKEATDAFLPASKGREALVDAYEKAVQTADEISDRLRREADRVAKKARLLAERETRERHRKRLSDNLAEAENALTKTLNAWKDMWSPLGISPLSPREMRAWVQNRRAMCEKYSDIQNRTRKAAILQARIDQERKALGQALAAVSERMEGITKTLTALIQRGRRLVDQNDSIRGKREALLRDIEQRTSRKKEMESRIEQIQKEFSRWEIQWAEAVRPLGLGSNALPEEANAIIEDLKDLFEKRKDTEILGTRIKGIDRDAAIFSQKVMHLARYVAPELQGLPVEQAVTELNGALTRARSALSEHRALKKQQQEEARRLKEAEASIADIRSRLDAMCEEAGCPDYANLKDAEERSMARRRLEAGVKDMEEHLLRLSAGSGIDGLLKEIEQVDPDGIDAQTARLSEEMEALETERSRLDQTIGEVKNELSRMDGSSRAADLAGETQTLMAGLEAQILAYARLRLASIALSRFIERYREAHQAPVLKQASRLFRQLTLGSFDGIRADLDTRGHPVLVGVRSGGKELVGVHGMSDGTADQLYLALRLASLQTYLDHNPAMPFIVDDIMIKFDDGRTAAALQVLADLSKRTQVIVFTHHRHLMDLADAAIDPSLVFKHTLQH
ncbi:MAG: AAA family ATPase [Deltaproteobacteria bacterium]|nr:AAA family ATPase [Deltaproteobacteria bacterium]